MSDSASAQRIPAAIYARVSTFKQVGGRFDSCEAQGAVCRDLIEKHAKEGWYEEAAFFDPAYSGKNMERPGMRALKEAIGAKRIRLVISYKIERLLRSTDEWPSFRKFLKDHDCQLVSVSEGMAEESAAGRFRTHMLVGAAAYERESTSEKVRNKLHQQAKMGIWNGGLSPFGYAYSKKRKSLRPNKKEFPIVTKVYERAAALVSLTALAEELNKQGVRTREREFKKRDGTKRKVGGVRIRSDWLRMLIRNPIYRGVVRSQGEEFRGRHKAIVDFKLWEAANAAIRQTLKPARCNQLGRDRHFNVLKGLVFCGDCGHAMVPHASGKLDQQGKPYRYYSCTEVLREHGDARCRVRRVNAPAIELCVVSLLGQLARRPMVIEAVLAAGNTKTLGKSDESETGVRRLDRDLGQITQQLRNIVDALANGGLKALDSELRARMQQLTARKDALLVERERVQQELDASKQEQLAPTIISTALGKFDLLWSNLTAGEKRELVNLAIARVEIRAARNVPASVGEMKHRSLHLCVKLHLPELLAAGGGLPALREYKPFAIDAAVQMPGNSAGDVLITAPFTYRVSAPVALSCRQPKKEFHGGHHPLHRALALEKLLIADPRLTPQQLAIKEGISPSSICQWRKLTRLSPAVQEALLKINDRATAWRCSIRRLLPLLALSPAKQWQEFEEIRRAKRPHPRLSAATRQQ